MNSARPPLRLMPASRFPAAIGYSACNSAPLAADLSATAERFPKACRGVCRSVPQRGVAPKESPLPRQNAFQTFAGELFAFQKNTNFPTFMLFRVVFEANRLWWEFLSLPHWRSEPTRYARQTLRRRSAFSRWHPGGLSTSRFRLSGLPLRHPFAS